MGFCAAYRGRFTLLLGDINCGKTTRTQALLHAWLLEEPGEILVLDLAPEIPARAPEGQSLPRGIGGVLQPPLGAGRLLYVRPRLVPPRLLAADQEEAECLALKNAQTIEEAMARLSGNRPGALFVNDCSLYLQAGDPDRFLAFVRSATTAIVNGYYGWSLGRGRISRKERSGMDALILACDEVLWMDPLFSLERRDP